jgi:hypothetical protein
VGQFDNQTRVIPTKYARTPKGVKSESNRPACILRTSSGEAFSLGLAAPLLIAASIAAQERIAEK